MRMFTVAALALPLLLGACGEWGIIPLALACASGACEVTREDLLDICEEARTCVVAECSDEVGALAELDASEPDWAISCAQECSEADCPTERDGVMDCPTCEDDCQAARDAEEQAWFEAKDAASGAYAVCQDQCQNMGPPWPPPDADDCALGRWEDGPEWCAQMVGLDLLTAPDCDAQVAAASF
jgi:hypothetical protein